MSPIFLFQRRFPYNPCVTNSQFKKFRCRNLTCVDVKLTLTCYLVVIKLSNFTHIFRARRRETSNIQIIAIFTNRECTFNKNKHTKSKTTKVISYANRLRSKISCNEIEKYNAGVSLPIYESCLALRILFNQCFIRPIRTVIQLNAMYKCCSELQKNILSMNYYCYM